MSPSESVRPRLETQLEALDVVLAGTTPALVDSRSASGDWSARENLAHLARHSTVLLERLDRILREDTPSLGRYRAEDDPDWPDWSALPLDDVLRQLKETRRRLITWVRDLSPDQLARKGLHPSFGAMTIPEWLEFFLLHEAHHLYTAMLRTAEAKRTASPPTSKQG
jgi:DinB family protein